MGTSDGIALIGMVVGFLFQGAVLLFGMALAWGRVKSTLDHLTESIKDLTSTLKEQGTQLSSHGERLARLEGKGP